MKILIVDDMPVYARIIGNVLKRIPGVEVVGTASDGLQALTKISELKPDLITLDIEMPKFDGLEVLHEINQRGIKTGVIVISGLTASSAELTTQALQLGAFDFVLKPTGTGGMAANSAKLLGCLEPRIRAFAGARNIILPNSPKPMQANMATRAATSQHADLVVIACSTGGPAALRTLLSQLPRAHSAPIVIAQHMPPQFTQSLARNLNDQCPMYVVEAANGMQVEPNTVYVAPGGLQTRIVAKGRQTYLETSDQNVASGLRPSADFLFHSAVEAYGRNLLGVVLTGMGDDGRRGSEEIVAAGGTVFAQEAQSCVVYGMPRAVVEANLAHQILTLDAMAKAIFNQCNKPSLVS
ncbi:MAG: chemotaxis-specific protein-glutamate methyltransferase CheB [Planctomycetales bacterium]|nr:chemotaxis-specific protein-glutamate methyltransferase CheB [Planctomycetales bacterium]